MCVLHAGVRGEGGREREKMKKTIVLTRHERMQVGKKEMRTTGGRGLCMWRRSAGNMKKGVKDVAVDVDDDDDDGEGEGHETD